MTVRLMEPAEEVGTLRVPVDGISAVALSAAYARARAAQDEIVTILTYLCRQKHLDPDKVIGFDDGPGELVVRP